MNPWLEVPLGDYEGHMNSAEVRQLSALADLFAEALAARGPASVAILGVAGGNGLERIDSDICRRVVGVDINAAYLQEATRRFGELRGWEAHCIDLSQEVLAIEPVEMVHAALIFEHAGTGACLKNAVSLVARGGALSVVLQLPGIPGQDVGRGGFASMEKLRPHFTLIAPEEFCRKMGAFGFELSFETKRSLPAGKTFWMGIFKASAQG